MEQEKIVEMISAAEQGWDIYRGIIQKAEDMYFMIQDSGKIEDAKRLNRSHIFYPKITSKCRRITDSLNETYFENETLVKLGKYINSNEIVLEKWQKAVDHYQEMIDTYTIFQPIFMEAGYRPSEIVKVFWANDVCQIEKVEIEDIWFDPNAKFKGDERYLVHNIYLTIDDMKALQKIEHFKKSIKIDEIFTETKPCEKFRLQEIYFLEGGEWNVTTVWEQSEYLRENVKLKDGQPFVWGYMCPQTKRVLEEHYIPSYGEIPINIIIPLQEELNTIRNLAVDSAKSAMFPKFIKLRSDGVTRDDLETVGKPIDTTNPSAIRELAQPNPQAALALMPVIEQDMAEGTGISPQQNGVAPNRKETATMATIMANEGSIRIQGYVRTFNETFFEKIFERFTKLVWKYGDDSFFLGIDRTETPSFKVSVNTGIGALNKEVIKQSLIEANQMVSQQLQMRLSVQDIEGAKKMIKVSERILEDLLPLYGIKNLKEIMESDDDDREGLIENAIGESQGQPEITGALPEQNILASMGQPAL